jgi:hypothetical protein
LEKEVRRRETRKGIPSEQGRDKKIFMTEPNNKVTGEYPEETHRKKGKERLFKPIPILYL